MKLGKRIYSNISEDELYKTAVQVINSKEIAESVEDIKLKMEKTNADIDAIISQLLAATLNIGFAFMMQYLVFCREIIKISI